MERDQMQCETESIRTKQVYTLPFVFSFNSKIAFSPS